MSTYQAAQFLITISVFGDQHGDKEKQHDRSSVINLVGQLSWVDTHATFYTVFARRNRT